MSIEQKIKDRVDSWNWRIVKAGYNQSKFAKELGFKPSRFYTYVSGRVTPHMSVVDLVETKLKELGV